MRKYLFQKFLPNCDTEEICLGRLMYDGKGTAHKVAVSELDEKIDTEEDLICFLRQFSRDDILVLTYDRPDDHHPILREYAKKTLASYLYWIRHFGYTCYWERGKAAS